MALRSPFIQLSQQFARRGARNWGWYYRAKMELENPVDTRPKLDLLQNPVGPRAKAFLDVKLGDSQPRRIVVELASDIVPRTVENFLKLCKGEGQFGYKGCTFHRAVRNAYVAGGDVLHMSGRGGHSALGSQYFDDENFVLRHSIPGVISMANGGVNKNNSQFFITATPSPHLDGRYVAFGRVVEGMDFVKELSLVFTAGLKPITDIVIADCGEL